MSVCFYHSANAAFGLSVLSYREVLSCSKESASSALMPPVLILSTKQTGLFYRCNISTECRLAGLVS